MISIERAAEYTMQGIDLSGGRNPSAAELETFAEQCTALGLTTPAPITRTLALVQVATDHAAGADDISLLDATDEQARAWITDRSIRGHDRDGRGSTLGMRAGVVSFTDQILAEARAATLPLLDGLVKKLQPRFKELAAPLEVAAQEFGFTYATNSDDVINLADEAASAAWRNARDAFHAVREIAAFRQSMSRVFRDSPTPDETLRNHYRGKGVYVMPGDVNYSVCFAAGDNWSWENGYQIGSVQEGMIDWFALAAGGLALNTPSEVREKIANR